MKIFSFSSPEKENIFKITLFSVIAAFFLLLIIYLGYLNHIHFKRAIIDQTKQQLLIIAKSEAQSIQKYLDNIDRELEILSSKTAVRRALLQKETFNESQDYYFLEDSYKDIRDLADSIYLIDSNGIVIDVDPSQENLIGQNLSQIIDIKTVLINKKTDISKIFETDTGALVITNIHPVFDHGAFIGLVRAIISVDRINNLVSHINQSDATYTMLIDNNSTILSTPLHDYIGKNILKLINERAPNSRTSEARSLITKMIQGETGVKILSFPSMRGKPEIVKAIIGFAPIHIGNEIFSISVAINYDTIVTPIIRNIRDNVIFTGFVLLVFTSLAIIIYNIYKKNSELAISKTALNIINRELHVEINERERIEKELSACLHKRGDNSE